MPQHIADDPRWKEFDRTPPNAVQPNQPPAHVAVASPAREYPSAPAFYTHG